MTSSLLGAPHEQASAARPAANRCRRAWFVVVLALLLVAAAVLIDRLPQLLIAEERWEQADYVLVLGSGDCLVEAAHRYRAGLARQVLLVGRRKEPAVHLKILPSYEENASHRLSIECVPAAAVELIPANARDSWDIARALAPWLSTHSGAKIDVLCDRMSSAREGFLLRSSLDPDQGARLRFFGLPDPAIVENGWWHHRHALKAVASASVAFAFDYLHGPPSEGLVPHDTVAHGEARK